MVNLKVKYVALRLNARNVVKKMSCHCKCITPVLFVKSYTNVNASEELTTIIKNVTATEITVFSGSCAKLDH